MFLFHVFSKESWHYQVVVFAKAQLIQRPYYDYRREYEGKGYRNREEYPPQEQSTVFLALGLLHGNPML